MEQEFTSWEELMFFGCFISARQLNLMPELNATVVIDLILNFEIEHSF